MSATRRLDFESLRLYLSASVLHFLFFNSDYGSVHQDVLTAVHTTVRNVLCASVANALENVDTVVAASFFIRESVLRNSLPSLQ